MADVDLNNDTDSGKAERLCDFCLGSLPVQNKQTKFCCGACREEYLAGKRRMKAFDPNRAVVKCNGCSSMFVPTNIKAAYCSQDCKSRHFARVRNDTGQGARLSAAYRARNPEKVNEASRRYAKEKYSKMKADPVAYDEWKAKMERYQTPEKKREAQRRRHAQAALSAILLPVQEHPEV